MIEKKYKLVSIRTLSWYWWCINDFWIAVRAMIWCFIVYRIHGIFQWKWVWLANINWSACCFIRFCIIESVCLIKHNFRTFKGEKGKKKILETQKSETKKPNYKITKLIKIPKIRKCIYFIGNHKSLLMTPSRARWICGGGSMFFDVCSLTLPLFATLLYELISIVLQ